jgi:pimeloyl-ACP methyl ester carboxylesterase
VLKTNPRFLDLKSGLRIAYEEYGDPRGEPILFCHGWPSSRTMAEVTDVAARELGLRIISPDRPGIALSQFQPGRTVLDWPPIFAELAAALGFARYRVLGVSGGAPYAFAAAWARPTEVQAVAVVSGAPPLAGHDASIGLVASYKWLLKTHRRSPEFIRFLFRTFRPMVLLPFLGLFKPFLLAMQTPADRAALNSDEAFEICFQSSRAAWRQGATGVTHDAEQYAAPWGFELHEIQVPVRLWHGKADRSFSWKLAESIADKIPSCTAHFLENEGHYSVPIVHVKRILEDLKNSGN